MYVFALACLVLYKLRLVAHYLCVRVNKVLNWIYFLLLSLYDCHIGFMIDIKQKFEKNYLQNLSAVKLIDGFQIRINLEYFSSVLFYVFYFNPYAIFNIRLTEKYSNVAMDNPMIIHGQLGFRKKMFISSLPRSCAETVSCGGSYFVLDFWSTQKQIFHISHKKPEETFLTRVDFGV